MNHALLFASLLLPAWAFTQGTSLQSSGRKQLHRIDARTLQGLQVLFSYTAEALPLVSAHRGGPQSRSPENCIETFEHTLQHTYAMLEIDPRLTKDGDVVIHHDQTLDRTTTGAGPVQHHTLDELKRLRLRDADGNVTEFTIPTLDETLEWARGKAILVLDQKDVPLEVRVRKIQEHQAESHAMVIVNRFRDARACYELNPNVMMEVMIPNRQKAAEFDSLGVPWRNVIAFVGHNPPEDKELYEFIHSRGAMCMIGTSRNLDRQWLEKKTSNLKEIEPDDREFLSRGADVIETDIPVPLGPMLFRSTPIADSEKQFFSVERVPVYYATARKSPSVREDRKRACEFPGREPLAVLFDMRWQSPSPKPRSSALTLPREGE